MWFLRTVFSHHHLEATFLEKNRMWSLFKNLTTVAPESTYSWLWPFVTLCSCVMQPSSPLIWWLSFFNNLCTELSFYSTAGALLFVFVFCSGGEVNFFTRSFLLHPDFSLEKVPRSGFSRSRTLRFWVSLSQAMPCYFSEGSVGSGAKKAALQGWALCTCWMLWGSVACNIRVPHRHGFPVFPGHGCL